MLSLLLALALVLSLVSCAFAEETHYPDATDNPSVTAYISDAPNGFPVTAVPDTLTVAQGG